MIKKTFFFFLINLFSYYVLFSFELLSDGYKDIKLGMSKTQVEEILKKTTDFNPLKDEILTTRLEPDTEIISTEGIGFIIYAYFHFDHEQLFQIFLKIDEKRIGYYYLLKKLTNKFGNPVKFNPKRSIWENDKIKIILEKPCNLKYIYLPIWNNLIIKDQTSDNIIDSLRDKFSDGL